jgi:hypothetical protein
LVSVFVVLYKGGRYFLVEYIYVPKRGKNIPDDYKITKCQKIYPMVVIYY